MHSKLDDSTLAYRLAIGTGEVLKGIRNVGLLPTEILGDMGDGMAQEWIARVLSEHRPEDRVLSEEAADDLSRLDHDRVWIIDPLDGTKEYSTGRQDWAVHIALAEQGKVTHAAVGIPDMGHVFSSAESKAVTGPMAERIVYSHNSTQDVAEYVAGVLDSEVNKMGSAGAKAMSVLLGDNDAYIHAGGQYEWDNAAPTGVCTAAGLWCSRLDGSPLTYNNENPYLPDVLIARPEIADTILEAVEAFHSDHGSYSLSGPADTQNS